MEERKYQVVSEELAFNITANRFVEIGWHSPMSMSDAIKLRRKLMLDPRFKYANINVRYDDAG